MMAHIFEIHQCVPLRLGEALQSFEIDPPDPAFDSYLDHPHDLNASDSHVSVVYDEANDVLTFSGNAGFG